MAFGMFLLAIVFSAVIVLHFIVGARTIRSDRKAGGQEPVLSDGFARIGKSYAQSRAGVGVSVIKPVKGVDPNSFDNFASFCEQDYEGAYEIIFSLQDPADPALQIIDEVRRRYRAVDIKVTCNPVINGLSAKASNLLHGVNLASYDVIVFSDSDMHADRSFIRRLCLPFKNYPDSNFQEQGDVPRDGTQDDPGIIGSQACKGIAKKWRKRVIAENKEGQDVACVAAVPITKGAEGIWGYCYQLQLNSTILIEWLPYAQKQRVGIPGGTVAVRRDALEAIGGVKAFGQYVADDVELGFLLADAGYKIAVGPTIESYAGRVAYPALESLIARGAVIFAVMFGARLGAIFGMVSYYYIAAIALGLISNSPVILLAGFIHLCSKMCVAFLLSRFLAGTAGWAEALVVPVLDSISIWVGARTLLTRKLRWRGITYSLDSAGRLINSA